MSIMLQNGLRKKSGRATMEAMENFFERKNDVKMQKISNNLWGLLDYQDDVPWLELIRARTSIFHTRSSTTSTFHIMAFFRVGPGELTRMDVYSQCVEYTKVNLSSGCIEGKAAPDDFIFEYLHRRSVKRLDYCPYYNSFVVHCGVSQDEGV